MRSTMKRFVSSILLTLFVTALFPVRCNAVAGSWSRIGIDQHDTGHPSGCTIVTYQLILQNSGLLDPKWQLPAGRTASLTSQYVAFNAECGKQGLFPAGAVNLVNTSSLPKVGNAMCPNSPGWEYAHDGVEGVTEMLISGDMPITIGKIGGKRLDAMNETEIRTVMKVFYNCGFFCVLGIYYPDASSYTNGPAGYRGNHWVMFVNATDEGVYINDPANGGIHDRMEDKTYNGGYKIRYIIPIRSAKSSPLAIDGGQISPITPTDTPVLQELDIPTSTATGLTPLDLLSHCALIETNLEEELIIGADSDNLGQLDLEQLEGWRDNLGINNREEGFISILRWIISFVGIVLTLWALFVYLAFWFDHINSFFYIDLLHILTFGKLHICPPGEKPTFSMGKDVKDRTVNHAQILFICITALLFGALLISGTFYKVVSKLIWVIKSLLYGKQG